MVAGASRRRLGLELMEDRRMMAAGSVAFDSATGVLSILGTNGYADTVKVAIDYGHAFLTDDDQVAVTLQNVGAPLVQMFPYRATLGLGIPSKLPAVTKIVFQGYGGNDWFDNLTGIKSDAYGGAGLDTLLGGSAVDRFFGGDNDDYLDGRLGNDFLYGDGGRDAIFGDAGVDSLFGGADHDWLHGGAGVDALFGEAENDWLFGGADADTLNGGSGINTLYADYGDANTPVGGYATFDWFDRNLQDGALRSLARVQYRDGSLGRSDMFGLYDQTKQGGAVSDFELADLKDLTSQYLTMPESVRSLATKLAHGDRANNWYGGADLGDLEAGSTDDHLQKLVNKWFLGLDRPEAEKPYQYVQGSLYVGGPNFDDIDQQYVGDCYFLAALAEVAQQAPGMIMNMITDNGDGTFAVRFYHGNKAEYVTVDRYLPVRNEDGTSQYAGFGGTFWQSTNELWVSLLEKAYAQVNESDWIHQNGENSYQGLAGGSAEYALQHITSKDARTQSLHFVPDPFDFGGYLSTFEIRDSIIAANNQCLAITFSSNDSGVGDGVIGNHVYALLGYNAATQRFQLYNPWGDNNGEPAIIELTWTQVRNNFSTWTSARLT
jgi:Ca2+-binding RTX toxin-like protein